MFDSYLSYGQLKTYCKMLLEKGLAEEKDGEWVSTDKGRAYLRAYKEAAKIMEDANI
jgi:predicted transcriptional regulator